MSCKNGYCTVILHARPQRPPGRQVMVAFVLLYGGGGWSASNCWSDTVGKLTGTRDELQRGQRAERLESIWSVLRDIRKGLCVLRKPTQLGSPGCWNYSLALLPKVPPQNINTTYSLNRKWIHFYHANLGPTNIILSDDGFVKGILDWESAGFYPRFWISLTPYRSNRFNLDVPNDSHYTWADLLISKLSDMGFALDPEDVTWHKSLNLSDFDLSELVGNTLWIRDATVNWWVYPKNKEKSKYMKLSIIHCHSQVTLHHYKQSLAAGVGYTVGVENRLPSVHCFLEPKSKHANLNIVWPNIPRFLE